MKFNFFNRCVLIAVCVCFLAIPQISKGIIQPRSSRKLNIYPTPTHYKLFISGINSRGKYSILNIYGQVLIKGNIVNNEAPDLKFLKSWNYLIRFKNSNEIQTEKFIKL